MFQKGVQYVKKMGNVVHLLKKESCSPFPVKKPRGRNFALIGTQGEVGVSLKTVKPI